MYQSFRQRVLERASILKAICTRLIYYIRSYLRIRGFKMRIYIIFQRSIYWRKHISPNPHTSHQNKKRKKGKKVTKPYSRWRFAGSWIRIQRNPRESALAIWVSCYFEIRTQEIRTRPDKNTKKKPLSLTFLSRFNRAYTHFAQALTNLKLKPSLFLRLNLKTND